MSRSSFISSFFLHCAGAPPNYGNTKGQAFGLFCAQRVHLGPPRPSLPTPALLLCVCCVIRCDTKTSLSSSLCQPAALHWKTSSDSHDPPTDWTSDPLTPSHRDGAQIHHYYMQTSGLLHSALIHVIVFSRRGGTITPHTDPVTINSQEGFGTLQPHAIGKHRNNKLQLCPANAHFIRF
ncbi:hypothetical protein INR49_032609 [Caranx melampygus]|nr:hypothetical protein INR49_032609 [Caranx melampygus]